MIVFKCSQCQTRIEVEERYAGHNGKCQTCGAPITVPVPEQPMATGLDALRELPDAPPENFGAYGKAADAHWVDPATKAAEALAAAPKVPEEEPVVLPDVPAEILAAAKARQRQNIKYIASAVLITLVVIVLLLPLLMPKPKAEEPRKEITPAPSLGEKAPR